MYVLYIIHIIGQSKKNIQVVFLIKKKLNLIIYGMGNNVNIKKKKIMSLTVQ